MHGKSETPNSAALSDTETLYQLGYAQAIDQTVSPFRLLRLSGTLKLKSFVRRVVATYGVGLEDSIQTQTWL